MTTTITAFFLGGTISMAGAGEAGGAVARLGSAELVAAVPQLAALGVTVEARDFRRLPSAALGYADVMELAGQAREAVAAGSAGVVVVQGTDTIEETTYLLDLIWPDDAPVVVTGAMRTPTAAGADGPANLLAAVAVAAGDAFRGQGALVVLADEVHAARFVRKTDTTSVATFASPGAGPLGRPVEGVPVRLTQVPRRRTLRPLATPDALVPVLAVGMGEDPETVTALGAVADGLVVAGLGAGHVPPALAAPLGDLARRIPVVLASRTGSGPVLTHTYGAPGSETDLLARGLIGAGLLHPDKARVLLRVALACGYDLAGVRSAVTAASGVG